VPLIAAIAHQKIKGLFSISYRYMIPGSINSVNPVKVKKKYAIRRLYVSGKIRHMVRMGANLNAFCISCEKSSPLFLQIKIGIMIENIDGT